MDRAALGFLGGALVGGIDSYNKLQDEQRQFKIDQAKQEADYARRLNLARGVKGLEDAGIDRTTGIPISREQAALMSPEELKNIMGPLEMKKEELAAQYGYKDSQYINPATGAVLSNKEVQAWKDSHGGTTEGLQAVRQSEQDMAMQRMGAQAEYQAQAQERAASYAADRQDRTIQATEERQRRQQMADIAEQESKAKTKESAEEEKRLNKLQDAITATSKNVGMNVAKEADGYEPITGVRAIDVAAYSKRDTIAALNQIQQQDPSAAQKLISRSDELARTVGIHEMAMNASAQKDPYAYLATTLQPPKNASKADMQRMSDALTEVVNYGRAAGLFDVLESGRVVSRNPTATEAPRYIGGMGE